MRHCKRIGNILASFVLLLSSATVSVGEEAMPWVPILLLSNLTPVTISGTATIPNYTPAGNLVVLVDGLDGNIYGAAMSDKDGNYSIKANVPKDLQQVFVVAVDPNDPNYYTAGYGSIVEDSIAEDSDRMVRISEEPRSGVNDNAKTPSQITLDLNARSIALSRVMDYSGRSINEFDSEEMQAFVTIHDSIALGKYEPRFCTQKKYTDQDDLLVALAKKRVNGNISDRFRAYASQSTSRPIVVRLIDGESNINAHVSSSNWERNRVGPAGFGVLVGSSLGPVGTAVGGGLGVWRTNYQENQVLKVRNILERFDFSTFNLQKTGWTTQDNLEAAVTIIYRQGWGNCQEKGLVAAYFGSLFDTDEFKQVAHVVAVTAKHSWFSSVFGPAEHSFAIACTKDQSVYDLMNLPDAAVVNNRVQLPDAFYDAGCYIIDPWAENMAELTRSEVDDQQWEEIPYIMGVNNRNQPNNRTAPQSNNNPQALMDSPLQDAQSCPVDMVCDVCSNKGALNDHVCQSWIPAPSTGTESNQRYYYLFKRSGSGYRKYWAGWSSQFTGYDYFYQYILPSEAETVKENWSKFDEATANACAGGPALCPCTPYPDIWTSGSIEFVGVFNTPEELEPYQCDNPHYGPYYLICNMWSEDSQPYPGYWPAITGICGN